MTLEESKNHFNTLDKQGKMNMLKEMVKTSIDIIDDLKREFNDRCIPTTPTDNLVALRDKLKTHWNKEENIGILFKSNIPEYINWNTEIKNNNSVMDDFRIALPVKYYPIDTLVNFKVLVSTTYDSYKYQLQYDNPTSSFILTDTKSKFPNPEEYANSVNFNNKKMIFKVVDAYDESKEYYSKSVGFLNKDFDIEPECIDEALFIRDLQNMTYNFRVYDWKMLDKNYSLSLNGSTSYVSYGEYTNDILMKNGFVYTFNGREETYNETREPIIGEDVFYMLSKGVSLEGASFEDFVLCPYKMFMWFSEKTTSYVDTSDGNKEKMMFLVGKGVRENCTEYLAKYGLKSSVLKDIIVNANYDSMNSEYFDIENNLNLSFGVMNNSLLKNYDSNSGLNALYKCNYYYAGNSTGLTVRFLTNYDSAYFSKITMMKFSIEDAYINKYDFFYYTLPVFNNDSFDSSEIERNNTHMRLISRVFRKSDTPNLTFGNLYEFFKNKLYNKPVYSMGSDDVSRILRHMNSLAIPRDDGYERPDNAYLYTFTDVMKTSFDTKHDTLKCYDKVFKNSEYNGNTIFTPNGSVNILTQKYLTFDEYNGRYWLTTYDSNMLFLLPLLVLLNKNNKRTLPEYNSNSMKYIKKMYTNFVVYMDQVIKNKEDAVIFNNIRTPYFGKNLMSDSQHQSFYNKYKSDENNKYNFDIKPFFFHLEEDDRLYDIRTAVSKGDYKVLQYPEARLKFNATYNNKQSSPFMQGWSGNYYDKGDTPGYGNHYISQQNNNYSANIFFNTLKIELSKPIPLTRRKAQRDVEDILPKNTKAFNLQWEKEIQPVIRKGFNIEPGMLNQGYYEYEEDGQKVFLKNFLTDNPFELKNTYLRLSLKEELIDNEDDRDFFMNNIHAVSDIIILINGIRITPYSTFTNEADMIPAETLTNFMVENQYQYLNIRNLSHYYHFMASPNGELNYNNHTRSIASYKNEIFNSSANVFYNMDGILAYNRGTNDNYILNDNPTRNVKHLVKHYMNPSSYYNGISNLDFRQFFTTDFIGDTSSPENEVRFLNPSYFGNGKQLRYIPMMDKKPVTRGLYTANINNIFIPFLYGNNLYKVYDTSNYFVNNNIEYYYQCQSTEDKERFINGNLSSPNSISKNMCLGNIKNLDLEPDDTVQIIVEWCDTYKAEYKKGYKKYWVPIIDGKHLNGRRGTLEATSRVVVKPEYVRRYCSDIIRFGDGVVVDQHKQPTITIRNHNLDGELDKYFKSTREDRFLPPECLINGERKDYVTAWYYTKNGYTVRLPRINGEVDDIEYAKRDLVFIPGSINKLLSPRLTLRPIEENPEMKSEPFM